MNADVIGFQEVVFDDLIDCADWRRTGYVISFCTGHPMFDPRSGGLRANPEWQLASRHPFVSVRCPFQASPGLPDTP